MTQSDDFALDVSGSRDTCQVLGCTSLVDTYAGAVHRYDNVASFMRQLLSGERMDTGWLSEVDKRNTAVIAYSGRAMTAVLDPTTHAVRVIWFHLLFFLTCMCSYPLILGRSVGHQTQYQAFFVGSALR